MNNTTQPNDAMSNQALAGETLNSQLGYLSSTGHRYQTARQIEYTFADMASSVGHYSLSECEGNIAVSIINNGMAIRFDYMMAVHTIAWRFPLYSFVGMVGPVPVAG